MGEDQERIEMIGDFVAESRELLEEIEPQIIAMEEHVSHAGMVDDEILNSIFRLFHSIKGMASFLDLQTVINVTHEAETLLDIFRKGKASLAPGHIELLYKTGDFIKGLLNTIEQQLSDGGLENEARGIIGEIQQTIQGIAAKADPAEEPEEQSPPDPAAWIFTITPEMIKRFIEDGWEILEEAETSLLQLENKPNHYPLLEQIFRSFHSFKGNAGFLGFSDLEQVSHGAENTLNEMLEGQVTVNNEAISELLKTIDSLRDRLGKVVVPYEQKIAKEDDLVGEQAESSSLLEQQQVLVEAERLPTNGNVTGGADPNKNVTNNIQQAIRVDVEKLDTLLDLVGEMVISAAMVSHNPDLQGLQLDRFEKAISHLNKITRDIQDVSMSLRMVPLAGIFRKMVRVVRDVSNKMHKKATLEIIGEDTEVDKTIIEQISDPLVHIMRNAVDHGLESPEQRRAVGKPETGRVILEARHTGGEVWILIRDDGKGLNRERILNKAIERGLLLNERQDLKDEEVWKLIFEPGLTTVAEISAISGRGVGMDVVRQNIEKLRGRIEIRSTPGQGTLFIIRIPLTLAIIEGMVVRVGKAMYTFPIASIKECFQPKGSQIVVNPDGLEVVNIRGELLPVIRLHQLYKVQPTFEGLTEGILIVMESEDQKCCLFVDELIGQQQIVIKPLPPALGNIRGVSGMAILGDGEVSMILDIANLMVSTEDLLGIKTE
ncbi:chemotaxis protein CheA [Desulfotomaculum sp. 1211_IL3151]|uniref:chemotaxis protein CheA n=1 Tax=Desulfotomaculum sp. 1211_IL3151 TaxID=3084055 RepID=UPI002FDB4434